MNEGKNKKQKWINVENVKNNNNNKNNNPGGSKKKEAELFYILLYIFLFCYFEKKKERENILYHKPNARRAPSVSHSRVSLSGRSLVCNLFISTPNVLG